MGATTFATVATGKNLQEAFNSARQRALAYGGHQEGYSGNVAAKHSVVLVTDKVLAAKAARKLEDRVLEGKVAAEVSDKWGPAGAIRLRRTAVSTKPPRGHEVYLFFGWAPE